MSPIAAVPQKVIRMTAFVIIEPLVLAEIAPNKMSEIVVIP